MFNTVSIEAIIFTFRRGSYKFEDTFYQILRLFEFQINLYRSIHSIIAKGKKVFEKIVKWKRGIFSRPCVVQGGLEM